jgi:Squalene-hopene cyclase C-terminal domain
MTDSPSHSETRRSRSASESKKAAPKSDGDRAVVHRGRQLPGWAVSTVVHMVGLLILGWATLPVEPQPIENRLLVAIDSDEPSVESLETPQVETPELKVSQDLPQSDLSVELEEVSLSPAADSSSAPMRVELSDSGLELAPRVDLGAMIGAMAGNDFGGRGEKTRQTLVARYGGSQASEAAVAAGLKWLAAHQGADGGWSFAHHLTPSCKGRCANPGVPLMVGARNGATGLALLPFLGAGITHKSAGPYRKTVSDAVEFLCRRMQPDGSLWEKGGTMYSHGIASIALCEAYAMTGDRKLAPYAQRSIDFISRSQDPTGGGWRYKPREKGDTSVTGWQVMALKSASLGQLSVSSQVVKKINPFLDSVARLEGSQYGYLTPKVEKNHGTTAVGLLCRMYLGWRHSNPALQKGVEFLSELGPSENDYYFNYYATQVLHHWEGELWEKWNRQMRDQTVGSQDQNGHQRGSWYFKDDYSSLVGGRLYCTAMAVMILEVYYRHMPIYANKSTTADFPLD